MILRLVTYIIVSIRSMLPSKKVPPPPPSKPLEKRCKGCNSLMYMNKKKAWSCPMCFGMFNKMHSSVSNIFIIPPKDSDDLF